MLQGCDVPGRAFLCVLVEVATVQQNGLGPGRAVEKTSCTVTVKIMVLYALGNFSD